MKRILISILAASSVAAVAAPAFAAPGQNVNAQQANVERRIEMGIRNGSLTRREAFSLRNQVRDIARLEYRYRQNGLSNWERRDLQVRLDRVSSQIRFERHDRQDRWGDNNYRMDSRGHR